MKKFSFDYGVVIFKHRFNLNRSLDDYKETKLDKCICISMEIKYKTMSCKDLTYELQILYRDDISDKVLCECLDLHEYTIEIIHKGEMQIHI